LYSHAVGDDPVPSSRLSLPIKIAQLIRQRVEEEGQVPCNEATCAWLQSRSVLSVLRIELSLLPSHQNLFPGLPCRIARSQIKCCIF